jgi:hypothetical protein
MATENMLSAAITNRDATPQVANKASNNGGNQKVAVATLECGTGDLGSTYRFVSVPSNAIIHEVKLYCDDMGTTGLADVGVYQTTENGSAVVDADFFASAVDMKTAALNGSDVTHESGAYNIDDAEKPLWQALGLSADSQRNYDIVLTTTEAFQAAGTVTVKVSYAI